MSEASHSEDKITSSSSPEEVAKCFAEKLKISQEVQENIIKQEISGDILLSLEDAELKSLGLKLGPMKKVKKYLSENKNDFIEKDIEIKIDINSTKAEVKEFLEKYIGMDEDYDLDGKELLELSNDDIESIGLNLEKKKKFEKYLKYFQSIKTENKEYKKEEPKEQKKEQMEEKEEKVNEEKDINDNNQKEEENKEKEKKENKEEGKEEENPVNDEAKLRGKNIKPIDLDSKNNIFFMISLTDNYNDNNFSIVACNGKEGDKSVDYHYNIISDEDTTALDEEKRRILVVQVPSEEKLKNLTVKILKKETIKIKKDLSSENKEENIEKEKNEIILDNEGEKEEDKDEKKEKKENEEKDINEKNPKAEENNEKKKKEKENKIKEKENHRSK